MSKLPPGLSMKDITEMPLPGDVTVGEAVAYMQNADWLKDVVATVPGAKRLAITFRWRESGVPLSDDMPLSEAQELSRLGKVVITMDIDRGGGVMEPV